MVTPGNAEKFKAGVHLALFALASMCLGYNAMAYAARRERHLAVNVLVYGSLAAYEVDQVYKHLAG